MEAPTIIVETTYGPIWGSKRTTILGDDFYSFRGIPYAKPPVGDLRFKDPEAPEPWTVPRDATNAGKSALSMVSMFASVADGNTLAPDCDEDCLFINVYTKELKPKKPLPVMVWIHGGGFRGGSSSEQLYGPDYLLQKNVVLISFNYRLGALGFLSISDPSVKVPGNAGLKDQTLALKWARSNAGRFGGNADNITIFGESAGGTSVHFHMVSDLSKGLFDKAIAQSGSVVSELALVPQNNWASRLAAALGWNGEGGDKAVYEFLKNAEASKIIEVQDSIRTPNEIKACIKSFGPAQEAYVSDQCFFIRDPKELVKVAWSAHVPMLIGGVVDEGLLFYSLIDQMKKHIQCQGAQGFEGFVPQSLALPLGSAESLNVAKRIMDFYYFDVEPTEENFVKTLQIMGDAFFWHGIYVSAFARLENPNETAPTYLYRFAVESNVLNQLKKVSGVCHGDDLMYLFRPIFIRDINRNSAEFKNIQRMVDMWTQFSSTGNPNGDELKTVIWEHLVKSTAALKCLNISDELSFIDLPETKRLEFWDSIFGRQQ